MASTLGSAVISARAELGSILVAALPEATLLTGQGGWLCGRAADGSDVFVAAHADGSLYVCERGKEPCAEPAFPPVRDPLAMQLSLAPKAAKSSPTARWWLGQGSGGGGGVPAGTCLAAPASARPLLRDTTSLDWKGAGDAPQQRSSMGSVAPRPCSMLTRYHRRVGGQWERSPRQCMRQRAGVSTQIANLNLKAHPRQDGPFEWLRSGLANLLARVGWQRSASLAAWKPLTLSGWGYIG